MTEAFNGSFLRGEGVGAEETINVICRKDKSHAFQAVVTGHYGIPSHREGYYTTIVRTKELGYDNLSKIYFALSLFLYDS